MQAKASGNTWHQKAKVKLKCPWRTRTGMAVTILPQAKCGQCAGLSFLMSHWWPAHKPLCSSKYSPNALRETGKSHPYRRAGSWCPRPVYLHWSTWGSPGWPVNCKGYRKNLGYHGRKRSQVISETALKLYEGGGFGLKPAAVSW